ncbi:MAG: HAD family phosphatase [Candidatus Buchananbacteria bacterium]
MIKGVIYDLDDLMVNSIGFHQKANQKVLKKYNSDFNKLPKDLYNKFVGMRVIDILETFIKNLNLKVDLETLKTERETIFLDLIKNELEAMPGLLESLNLFKKHNLKLAVASSGTTRYINIVLNKFNLINFFNVIISGDDVKNGKPNPETFTLAAKKLNLDPPQCLVLEDATNGIKAAKTAGCKCLAIKNPYTPPQDLTNADAVLNSLLQINSNILKL